MFSQIKSSINGILPKFFEDEDLTTAITWKRFESSEWSEDQGMNVDTYTEFSVVSIKLSSISSTDRSVVFPSMGRSKRSGDNDYLFKFGELPDNASNRDILVDDSNIYQVEQIEPTFGLIVRVTVKGYA